MARSVTQSVQAANAVVPRISVAQAQELIGKGGALVLDVREACEVLQSGKAGGAVHVVRGYSNSSRIPNRLLTIRVSRRADSGGAIDTAQA